MLKKDLVLGLILVFFILPSLAFCDTSPGESLTITTYYPSPYGSYNELRTNKMVIGDVASSTPAPSQGAVTFKPLDNPPDAYSEGTLYYDRGTQSFKYSNGSSWQPMGGAGGSPVPTGLYGYCWTNAGISCVCSAPAFCVGAVPTCPPTYTQVSTGASGTTGFYSCYKS